MHLQWCVDDNQVLLVKAKAHELIMSAMRAHPQAAQVQEAACDALRNLEDHWSFLFLFLLEMQLA